MVWGDEASMKADMQILQNVAEKDEKKRGINRDFSAAEKPFNAAESQF